MDDKSRTEKLDDFKKLNTKFYEIYGDLFENRELIGTKAAYDYMALKIFEQYKTDYEYLKVTSEIVEKPELYAAKVRHNELVPRRRFFFFRNRAMKLSDEEILISLEKIFDERNAALLKEIEAREKLAEALDKSDDVSARPTAFDREEKPKGESGQLKGQISIDEVIKAEPQ